MMWTHASSDVHDDETGSTKDAFHKQGCLQDIHQGSDGCWLHVPLLQNLPHMSQLEAELLTADCTARVQTSSAGWGMYSKSFDDAMPHAQGRI